MLVVMTQPAADMMGSRISWCGEKCENASTCSCGKETLLSDEPDYPDCFHQACTPVCPQPRLNIQLDPACYAIWSQVLKHIPRVVTAFLKAFLPYKLWDFSKLTRLSLKPPRNSNRKWLLLSNVAPQRGPFPVAPWGFSSTSSVELGSWQRRIPCQTISQGDGWKIPCFFVYTSYKTNMALKKVVGLETHWLLVFWDGLFSGAMFALGRVFPSWKKRWMSWSQPIEMEEIQHPWRQDSTRFFPTKIHHFQGHWAIRNLRPYQTPPPLVVTHGDAQRKRGLESCKMVTHWMQHEAIIALGLPWANARFLFLCVCVCVKVYLQYIC